MDNAVAGMLPAVLLSDSVLVRVPVPLVQFFGEELEKLVRVLLLGCYQVLEGLLLRDPEAGEYVGGSVSVSLLLAVELLEYVVHCTAYAVLIRAVVPTVPIRQIVIPKYGVVQEALEDDVLVTCGTSVVDASKAICFARRQHSIVRDVSRIVLSWVRQGVVKFSFTTRRKRAGTQLPNPQLLQSRIPYDILAILTEKSTRLGLDVYRPKCRRWLARARRTRLRVPRRVQREARTRQSYKTGAASFGYAC